MLYLIGIGLGEKDITQAGIEAISISDTILLDSHTAYIQEEKLEWIKKISKAEIKRVDRHMLEEGINEVLSMAKNSNVSIISNGDPLMATTHKTILIEAKKKGIDFSVIHSTSVLQMAIAQSGLDFYRFGPVCTIPKWSEHYKPVSFYETISINAENGLHAIALLDYNSSTGTSIRVEEAIAIMENAESHYKKGFLLPSKKIMLLCDIGTNNERKFFGEISSIKIPKDYRMATIIIPGKISDIENEYIENIIGV